MKIIIGADVVPTPSNRELFAEGNIEELIGCELQSVLKNADFRVFNLEVPLTDSENPIEKCGPNLIAPEASAYGYRMMGADLLTLANNHIMDQGTQGLEKTCAALHKQGIHYFGAGATTKEAAKPYVINQDGRKVGIYACCEHEFSVVTEKTAGANPFEPLESLDHIAELKRQCDYVIMLYHGGKEKYRYPSPYLQKVCRRMVEKGADLVVCQHSHCVGCEEKYLNGTIIYGQGNFIFDDEDDEYYRSGILVQVDENRKITYYPCAKKGNTVRLAQGEEAAEIMDGFTSRSLEICSEETVKALYQHFADEVLEGYLVRLGGKESFAFRAVNKLLGNVLRKRRLNRRYGRNEVLTILNMIECEAYRELLSEGLWNR